VRDFGCKGQFGGEAKSVSPCLGAAKTTKEFFSKPYLGCVNGSFPGMYPFSAFARGAA